MKLLLSRKEQAPKTAYEYTLGLQIGSITCHLKCRDTEIFQKLECLYRNYLTEKSPDITVEIDTTDYLSIDDLRPMLTRNRYMHQGNRFRSSGKLLKGHYNLESRTINIIGERNLLDPDNAKLNFLNQLIAMAYYAACKIKYHTNPPAMLVHACGILRNGRALVFTGPSDIGKTTVARLFYDKQSEVFNDEMLLISHPGSNGNSVYIQNAPILGEFLPGRNLSAPLSCILLLKQNHRTAYNYLDKAEAYLRFIRQVIAPSCVGDYDKKTAYSLLADFSSAIVQSVPVYELEFNLDKDSLSQIADELNGISAKEICE
jgi:hypothetical protein